MVTLYLCGAGNPEGVRLAHSVNEMNRRWDRIVVLDDDASKHGRSIMGVEITGPFAMLAEADPDAAEVVNLVGRSTTRRWLAQSKIDAYGLPCVGLVHPSVDLAGVDNHPDLMAYGNSTLGAESKVECGTVVFMGGVVGHGSRVGRCCIVAPNGVINARVRIGDGVYVGTNASILPDVKVGPWATIAAGSVAMKDVPAGATVMGNPAKVVLPLAVRLKLNGSDALPPEIRSELVRLVRPPSSQPTAPTDDAKARVPLLT